MASSSIKPRAVDVSKGSLNHERQFVENFVIVCLDVTFKRNDHIAIIIKEKLQAITNDVEMFDDTDACIDYITDLKNQRVLLIELNSVDPSILTIVHDLSVISALYILYPSEDDHQHKWLESLRKVKSIHTDMTKLIEQIKVDLRRIEHEFIGFEILNKPNVSLSISRNLNKQEYTFMHSQLLKDVFLKFEDNSTAELVKYCRTVHADNASQLTMINEFERDYDASKAIWWYTRDSFLYKMVNKALRTRDIEALYHMRTFIRHLHEQLIPLCPIRDDTSPTSTLTLYRGQRMSTGEFEKLKNNEGGLLSVSNFLSTSASRELAFFYAGVSDEETTGMVFELQVDLNHNTRSSFACIEQFSYFEEGEHEWLFSMGSVFRIGKIELLDGIWYIHLTLTNDQDEMLEKLTVHMSKIIQMQRPNPLVPLCRLFARMGEYKKSIELCEKNVESENGWEMKAILYDTRALICVNSEDNNNALKYHQQALSLVVQHVDKNDPLLASYYNNVAISYEAIEEDGLALQHYQTAVSLELRALQPDYTSTAYSYDSMGSILCYYFNKYDEAISYYERALKLMLIHLPSNHSDILSLCNDMADVYEEVNKIDEALNILYKRLHVQQMWPECHPHDIALTFQRMAELYETQGKTKEASEMLNKYHELENACHPSEDSKLSNPDIAAVIIRVFGSIDALLSTWDLSLTYQYSDAIFKVRL